MPLFDDATHLPRLSFPPRLTEATVRLVAGGVSLSLVAGFFMRAEWILPLLAVGFVLRVVAGPRLSPLARLAILLTEALRLPSRTVAGPPKQFAAAIGATVLTSASVLAAVGLTTAAWALAGAVAFLAGLEAALGFCLGCKIYAALFGCAECSPGTRSSNAAGPSQSAHHRSNLDRSEIQPFLLMGHDGALGLAALERWRWTLRNEQD